LINIINAITVCVELLKACFMHISHILTLLTIGVTASFLLRAAILISENTWVFSKDIYAVHRLLFSHHEYDMWIIHSCAAMILMLVLYRMHEEIEFWKGSLTTRRTGPTLRPRPAVRRHYITGKLIPK
jgi:hypothetical protein